MPRHAARAGRLSTSIAAGGWHGVAANAFQVRAHDVVLSLRTTAGRLDDAAGALRQHADKVAESICLLRSVVAGAGHGGLQLPAELRDLVPK